MTFVLYLSCACCSWAGADQCVLIWQTSGSGAGVDRALQEGLEILGPENLAGGKPNPKKHPPQ